MTIAYLMHEGVPDLDVVSGPQLHVTAVISELRKRGHRVRVLVARDGRPVWSDDVGASGWHEATRGFSRHLLFRLAEKAIRRTQSLTRFPYLNLFDSVRFADAASRALAGCDLIYERFGFMGYGGALAAARLRVPLVLEVNGDVPREMDVLGVGMSTLQRAVSMRIMRHTLAAASRVVCVTPALGAALAERMHLAASRVVAVPNGADVELFAAPRDVRAIRRRLGLASGRVVVFVGSFQPWHGVDLLLEAFEKVTAQQTDVCLALAGDGPGRAGVEARVQADAALRGRVRCLGRLENVAVADLLAVADLAVAPFPYTTSDIVGSPLKLFEYMAAGCGIVASRAPIHDVIEHEVTGVRVAPADPSALATAILRLLADDTVRRGLGARAREVARAKYSWSHTVDQLEAVFRAVVPP